MEHGYGTFERYGGLTKYTKKINKHDTFNSIQVHGEIFNTAVRVHMTRVNVTAQIFL